MSQDRPVEWTSALRSDSDIATPVRGAFGADTYLELIELEEIGIVFEAEGGE